MVGGQSARIASTGHAWNSIINDAFGQVALRTREGMPFFGRFRHVPIAGLAVAEVASSNEEAIRTRRHIARDDEEAFAFVLLREGELEIEQYGRSLLLRADCFTLLDLGAPYRLAHGRRTDLMALTIPAGFLRTAMVAPQRRVLEVFPATGGIGRISADLLHALAAEGAAIPEKLATAYAQRLTDMFCMLADHRAGESRGTLSATQDRLYDRCCAIIDNRLADADLDPAQVAAAAGISVRALHQLFQKAGQSVGLQIKLRRLDRGRRMLLDPARKSETIKMIALSCGFRSQQHFSTLFGQTYGCSPGAARRGGLPAANG
ncbi:MULTISPECIES: helix-turn-helix domain-containing protein [unclassified Beijerinckia]|uniref:AraC-like ligand-binding domain-containing protein n=1 Tax=unclassified Beijerinckia TaxID=2638183 RepID=UPI000896357F|nr:MULTISPECIES: helix-turn-helix domain-containing protein [unclassified Beijerinckia]MDH7799969.1 AraC family transcriptional activator of tynA and feaB [Beijerinckia sp. GAS462]SED44363.1 AraC-type DNA-binding protein [Beijerinckia sp. 28-YEA-48]